MKKLLVLLASAPLCAMVPQEKISPETICNSAVERCSKLSSFLLAGALNQGIVQIMIGKICTDVKEKNADDALKWYARLTWRIALDHQLLSGSQKKMYDDFWPYLDAEVVKIQPEIIKNLTPPERMAEPKKEALKWLREIVENSQCEGLGWRELFGKSDDTTLTFDDQELYNKRMKVLKSYGSIKEMS